MKKFACNYAIVRFSPYVETGEFANVGVVMICPQLRYFDFRLLRKRYGRVTKFFEELDAQVFRTSIYALRDQLDETRDVLKDHGFDRRRKYAGDEFALRLFKEIIRPRENIMRFGPAGTVLTDDPKTKINDLYSFYVERTFVTKQYRETVLEKGLKRILDTANIADKYVRRRIGDEEFHATFPFVELKNDTPNKIIKPLHLNHDTSNKILEHGGVWWFRIRELQEREKLPDQILFTIDGASGSDTRGKACREAVRRLEDAGVQTAPYRDENAIIKFAAAN